MKNVQSFHVIRFFTKKFYKGAFYKTYGAKRPMGGVNAPQSEKAICFKHLQHTDKKNV